MRYPGEQGAETPSFNPGSGAAGAVMVATIVVLFPFVPALADDSKPGASFAHKYFPSYADTIAPASLELKLCAPSFKRLVETNPNALPGIAQQAVPGGIHQGNTAVTVGPAAFQPVRFEYSPGDRTVLRVGDRTVDTGLLAAQARPMASFVANRNNGLVNLNDVAVRDGNVVYRPKVAGPYINTEEGYWLLWADAIAADSFPRVAVKDAPDGLTIVDSEKPVTIITVKWASVMRLAAESDPVAFETFVHQLESVRIASVPTPCRLEARIYR